MSSRTQTTSFDARKTMSGVTKQNTISGLGEDHGEEHGSESEEDTGPETFLNQVKLDIEN